MKSLLTFAALISFSICVAQVTPEQFTTWLNANHASPTEYVVSRFKQHDLIILGEDHAIKQNLDLVTAMIPALYRNGIYNLGMEFGASEVQPRLDSLVNAPAFSLDVARDLMFYYNVGWAYREYYEIAETVWKLNRTLPPDAPRFRIINLSYQYDWSDFRKGDVRTDEVMRRIFPKGTPDQYRAMIVDKEIMSKKQKALLLVGTPHAYTRYSSCHYDFLKDNFVRCDTDWLGQRLLAKYPNRVFNILLHQPFYNFPGRKPYLLSPGDGMIEKVMGSIGNRPAGFDLVHTPLGKITDHSGLSLGYRDFTLENYFDGYIYLAPLHKLKGCTFDPYFFANKTWAKIQSQIPDPDWRGPINNLGDLTNQIETFVDIKSRYVECIQPR